MLIGEFQHTIDAKGRLIIPSRFRDGLGAHFICTRGLDGCLSLYPMAEWEALAARLKQLPTTQSNARAFVRFLFAGATECVLDRQGRILIPGPLREYAQLDRDVVILGVSNRAEVWSLERWQGYTEAAAQSFNEIAEQLVDLGI